MARGGKRQGAPGKSYPNRTDMNQPIKVAPGQEYGDRKALESAQRVIPLPNAAGPGPAAPSPPVPGPGPVALPGQQPFTRPSDRPDEPVQTGLPMGAGAGPETLSTVGPAADNVGAQLRALYAVNPNNDILRLIELHDNGY